MFLLLLLIFNGFSNALSQEKQETATPFKIQLMRPGIPQSQGIPFGDVGKTRGFRSRRLGNLINSASANITLAPFVNADVYFSSLIGNHGSVFLFDFSFGYILTEDASCQQCFSYHVSRYGLDYSPSAKILNCSSRSCPFKPCSLNSSCPFDVYFKSGHFIGRTATETFNLGGSTPPVTNVVFGDVISTYSYSYVYVTGVAGFGPGKYSFLKQFAQATGRNAFSICYSLISTKMMLSKGGVLVIGKDAISTPGITYTPLLRNPNYENYYVVQIKSIWVGKVKAKIPASVFQMDRKQPLRGTLMDSWFNGLGLADEAFDPVISLLANNPQVRSLTRENINNTYYNFPLFYSFPYGATLQLENIFPNITIKFSRNAHLVLQGYQYVNDYSYYPNRTVYVNILRTGNVSRISPTNLQNVLAIFDVEGRRIGFKNQIC